MRREEITCPGCGHRVYLSPMDGWRNDSDGYTCEPPSTSHSMHIIPALIRRGVLDDLRAKVEALHAEALKWQKIREEEGYRETASLFVVEAEAYADVLALIDGSS